MKSYFETLKNEMRYSSRQESVKRVAAIVAKIAQEVFITKPLRMSALEFYNMASILTFGERDGIYVAEANGIKLSSIQCEVSKGNNCIERDIMWAAMSYVTYSFTHKNVEKEIDEFIHTLAVSLELMPELLNDPQFKKALHYVYKFEALNQAEWENFVYSYYKETK